MLSESLWNGFYSARASWNNDPLDKIWKSCLVLFSFRITKKIGDYGEYFLKAFPKLTIYVYNTLRQNPACSHFANFQDPSL